MKIEKISQDDRKCKQLMLVQDDYEILSTFDTALDVPNEDATQPFLFQQNVG